MKKGKVLAIVSLLLICTFLCGCDYFREQEEKKDFEKIAELFSSVVDTAVSKGTADATNLLG